MRIRARSLLRCPRLRDRIRAPFRDCGRLTGELGIGLGEPKTSTPPGVGEPFTCLSRAVAQRIRASRVHMWGWDALLLGRDRLVRNLTEHDFFGSSPQPADRITIVATITDFTPNDPDRHHDWIRIGRGCAKWRDADSRELKPLRDKPTDQLACQIAF